MRRENYVPQLLDAFGTSLSAWGRIRLLSTFKTPADTRAEWSLASEIAVQNKRAGRTKSDRPSVRPHLARGYFHTLRVVRSASRSIRADYDRATSLVIHHIQWLVQCVHEKVPAENKPSMMIVDPASTPGKLAGKATWSPSASFENWIAPVPPSTTMLPIEVPSIFTLYEPS